MVSVTPGCLRNVAMYCRVTSPQSQSVPSGERVAASFIAGRPCIISGTHFVICAGSVENSIPENSGLACNAA